jgi:hypothetical protein
MAVAILIVVTSILGIGAVVAVVSSGLRGPGEGDAPPVATPRRPPSLTASSSPTLPAAGTQRTGAGATAFVAFWFETLTYAVRTGDTAGLAAVSNPRCDECQGAITTIRKSYASDGSLRGGAYVVRSLIPSGLPAGAQPAVDVVFDRSPRSAVSAGGDVRADLPGTSFATCRVVLEWASGRWRMLSISSSAPIA